jgi:hypothetical protein
VLSLPSRGWISHTRSRDGVLYIFKRTWNVCTNIKSLHIRAEH